MLGTISGVTTPKQKTNFRKMDKPASGKSCVAEPSVKKSSVKKKSLLVTLAIPEIARPPAKIQEQSTGESSKKVSREPASPIRASKHAASESLAGSPKRPRNTVSKGITARDSAKTPRRHLNQLAPPSMLRPRACLQSQHPLNAKICESPSRNEPTQRAQDKSHQISEFIKQELPPSTQLQEAKHRELLQESNNSQNLALETQNSSHSGSQEQKVPTMSKSALRKLDLFASLLALKYLLKANCIKLKSTPQSLHLLQFFVLVPLEDLLKPVQLPRRSWHQPYHARTFLISRIAPALLFFPLLTPHNLSLPIVPALPGRRSENLPSNKYFELLDEYHKNTEEMIEQWSTLFGLIDTCAAHFEAVADGAAVFGVLHYTKSMICSRIAGLMAQLLVSTADSSLAQRHYGMVKQANQAFKVASLVLDTSYVRRAFPELWKHFESKGFAGYPPLRPPVNDSANFTHFGRYILFSYLQMKGMEEPTCLEDDITCIGLPFLDPYI
ncbi:hypothetical protein L0F63_003925 [Massospora cicadina]|nr:hypothetical protein L0F63_003925 [Massospora cicadina]